MQDHSAFNMHFKGKCGLHAVKRKYFTSLPSTCNCVSNSKIISFKPDSQDGTVRQDYLQPGDIKKETQFWPCSDSAAFNWVAHRWMSLFVMVGTCITWFWARWRQDELSQLYGRSWRCENFVENRVYMAKDIISAKGIFCYSSQWHMLL